MKFFFYMYSFFSWINIRKHLKMNLKIMKRDRKQQIVSLVQRKFKLNCWYFPNITLFSSRWAPGALVSAVIKPVTSWFWRAASLLISIPKRRHKGACRSFFLNTSDCWGGKSAMMLKHRMRLCICFHPRATPLWTERDETDAAHLKDYNWLSRAAVRAQICQRDSAALRNAESYDLLQ